MDPYLAEIRLFAGLYEPRGWMFCDGRELPINRYQALFSLLGWSYGGSNSTMTFRLPDLRGRVPVGTGAAPGLTHRSLGEMGGAERVQLTAVELPNHTHTVVAGTAAGNASDPTGAFFAASDGGDAALAYSTASPDQTFAADALTTTGGGLAHDNMQPAIGLNHMICISGIYPSRW